MKAVPQSFDFDGSALRPDYVVKTSYGNDSIALIQWLHEYDLKHPLGLRVMKLFPSVLTLTTRWRRTVSLIHPALKKPPFRLSLRFFPTHPATMGMLTTTAS